MNESTLIKLTQYAYAVLGKSLPRGYVLKYTDYMVPQDTEVSFHKYERADTSVLRNGFLQEYTNKPVGLYFKDEHRYELRSKIGGYTLIEFIGKELDDIIEELS